MSLLDKASLIVTPNAYKESKLYSVIPSSGAGDMDVVRATTATRVNSAGLIEVVPRNLLQYSEQFDNAIYSKININVTANAIAAPNGTTTADKIIPTTTNSAHAFYQAVPTGSYTFSIYAKAAEETTFSMWLNDFSKRAIFDLTTGTITSTSSGTVANITSVGNGWYKCDVYDSTLTSFVAIYSRSGNGFAGNNSDGMYFWGAQAENRTTATEYFPTTTRLNIPRIDYTNGSCPSLLVEPQRSNLLTYSQQFDDSSWVKVNANVTANSTISPDGTQNADTLSSIIAAENSVTKSLAISINTTYTFSVYIKKDNNESRFSEIILRTEGVSYVEQYVQLNTKTGATNIRYQNGTVSHKVESLGNYWKVILTNVGLLDTLIIARIRPAVTDVFGTYNPQIGSVIAYGSQLEAGSYPTSYIPTVASSVTRNADVISKTGISSLIGQTEGTMFLDLKAQLDTTDVQDFSISDGTTNNRIIIRLSNSGIISAVGVFGGSVQFNIGSTSYTTGTRYKIALAYKNNDVALYINGTNVALTNTFTISGTLSRLGFDVFTNGAQIIVSPINSAQLYKTRLTNTELAQLTTL